MKDCTPPSLVSIAPDVLVARVQDLLESGPGPASGQVLELFLRRTRRTRVEITGKSRDESRSVESGLAVRRIDRREKTAGFAAAAEGGREAYLELLRSADRFRTPLDVETEPASRRDREARIETRKFDPPSIDEMTDWLGEAIREVEKEGNGSTTVKVVNGWVETGITGEAVVNSLGVQVGRARSRVWAGMQVRVESGRDAWESFRLLVPRAGGRLPEWEPLLDRLQTSERGRRRGASAGLKAVATMVLLPEAAAVLVQAAALQAHGRSAVPGEPVGPGWCLADEPEQPGMPFGGAFDDLGNRASRTVLAEKGTVRARLEGPGHGWRRSYHDPPAAGFSNLVVNPPIAPRPGGPVVVALSVHRLTPEHYFAVGESSEGRIRFRFHVHRVPSQVLGGSGKARETALGIRVPELIVEGRMVTGLP